MLRPLFDFVRTADTVIFSAPRGIIAGKQRAKKDGKFYISNCIPCPYHDCDILGHFVKLGKAHIERMLYRVSLLDFNNGSEAGFVPSPVDGKPFYLKIFASAYLEISVAVKDEHRVLGVDENILERI